MSETTEVNQLDLMKLSTVLGLMNKFANNTSRHGPVYVQVSIHNDLSGKFWYEDVYGGVMPNVDEIRIAEFNNHEDMLAIIDKWYLYPPGSVFTPTYRQPFAASEVQSVDCIDGMGIIVLKGGDTRLISAGQYDPQFLAWMETNGLKVRESDER